MQGGGFKLIGDVVLLQNRLKAGHVTYNTFIFQSFRMGRLHPWQQINSQHLEWCPCKSLFGFVKQGIPWRTINLEEFSAMTENSETAEWDGNEETESVIS